MKLYSITQPYTMEVYRRITFKDCVTSLYINKEGNKALYHEDIVTYELGQYNLFREELPITGKKKVKTLINLWRKGMLENIKMKIHPHHVCGIQNSLREYILNEKTEL